MAPFTTSSRPDGATSAAASRARWAGSGTPGSPATDGFVTAGSRACTPSGDEVRRQAPQRTERPRGAHLPSDDTWLGGGRW